MVCQGMLRLSEILVKFFSVYFCGMQRLDVYTDERRYMFLCRVGGGPLGGMPPKKMTGEVERKKLSQISNILKTF